MPNDSTPPPKPTAFPLPLRNALAELAIAALEEEDARAALAWLGQQGEEPSPPAAARLAAVHLIDPGGVMLLAVHAPWQPAVAQHAERAVAASAAFRRAPGPGQTPVARAVAHAIALWNEGLFFEVHEVLEEVWRTATGDVRQALQGVIQVAVAFHHLAHGNRRGARSLLAEGRSRLSTVDRDILPSLDVDALRAAVLPIEMALAGDMPPDKPPRL